MPRLGHGKSITQNDLETAERSLAQAAATSAGAFSLVRPVEGHSFDFLFPGLQDDEANLLPQAANTPGLLKDLGNAMVDTDVVGQDSDIPAAYTYFGQFVDHDITLEIQQGFGSATMAQLLDPAMVPLGVAAIRNALLNQRTPALDLDSVYGLPAPRDPADGNKMLVGKVSPTGSTTPPGKRPDSKAGDDFHDLPREGRSPGNIDHDRAAVIGDPRNDENTIIGQLHTAFLRAHNALADQGLSFDQARRVLRQHYQHVVIQDFLKRVADPAVVDDIVANGNRWFDPLSEPSFMPLEFSVAGYRFGHSMVRFAYHFNDNFNLRGGIPATLDLLFTFTALSDGLGDFDTLPENWIIQWENIIGDDPDISLARLLDPSLAAVKNNRFQALFALQDVTGQPEQPDLAARLAVRNLLRGYRLRLPTGQAVAEHIGAPVLTKDEILEAAGEDQRLALEAGGFQFRTPLWYYVLAEAKVLGNGNRLGPVGSTLIAEVLVGLVRRSPDSILAQPGWTPSLPSAKPGAFELADILRLAGVLAGAVTPATHTVQEGDTLFGIAEAKLGDGDRWPQIYALNQALIRDPDRIFAGQVFVLPPLRPVGDIPRLHTVQRGDTLSGIARATLGDADRWPEIFALNRAILTHPDRIIAGQVLILPAA
ncbi:LysM peptidoglycan-binding domain-containing protein [Paractinoplanes hotanensis]|uniref:LysM peptidoglycan-binding domain-containing protein n=1 Tax=Paractinoplanes hotanensis TaxID=2906497 RepID=A0ABT0XRI1_9ACTN|nr:LysM peptidoglycan-binding domain-containing protein [Actinoplanes hotanensis]MCM4076376.1 LysM peptidoglycan-binding domain-containing protein [Actinoplanes hotanensis]